MIQINFFFLHKECGLSHLHAFHSTFITNPASLMSLSIVDCVTRGFNRHGCEEGSVYICSAKRMWEWGQAPGGRIYEPTGINWQLISWLVGEANTESKERYTCVKEGPSATSMADAHRSHTSLGECMLLIHWLSNLITSGLSCSIYLWMSIVLYFLSRSSNIL